ncbi:MAG TPA: sulfurtransferase-like selenium metabolism protein YedF [Deltaproteobacteria bacterium]|nr:sulfurtransferase-like selenium metabolism protein YedF [Deltaproteobacteria bacterium]
MEKQVKEIDARGLACPQPVILTKKALDDHGEIVVIVDNATSRENVRRFAASRGCEVDVEDQGGATHLHIRKVQACDMPQSAPIDGPVVVVIPSDRMGRGDDDLGALLMKSFIHTLLESAPAPEVIIFLNTGVRLTVNGSEVLDDLRVLSGQGVKILSCGTCLSFFELKEQLAIGEISNMYDIATQLLNAGRCVQV